MPLRPAVDLAHAAPIRALDGAGEPENNRRFGRASHPRPASAAGLLAVDSGLPLTLCGVLGLDIGIVASGRSCASRSGPGMRPVRRDLWDLAVAGFVAPCLRDATQCRRRCAQASARVCFLLVQVHLDVPSLLVCIVLLSLCRCDRLGIPVQSVRTGSSRESRLLLSPGGTRPGGRQRHPDVPSPRTTARGRGGLSRPHPVRLDPRSRTPPCSTPAGTQGGIPAPVSTVSSDAIIGSSPWLSARCSTLW